MSIHLFIHMFAPVPHNVADRDFSEFLNVGLACGASYSSVSMDRLY